MDKKSAITIINKQIYKLSKLEKPSHFESTWLVQTKTYIDKFFGNESNESKWFSNLSPGSKYAPDPIPFLNDCIETINHIGLYKKPKSNLLSTIPNWIIILLLPALLTLGIMIGRYTSDVQNIELKREVKLLKESISSRSDSYKVSEPINK